MFYNLLHVLVHSRTSNGSKSKPMSYRSEIIVSPLRVAPVFSEFAFEFKLELATPGSPLSSGHLLVNLGFLDFQMFIFSISEIYLCLQHMFGNYGGEISRKIIKVSWRDPGQNGSFWRPFLIHWDSNLPSNLEKWTFWCHVRPDPAKVREESCVCSVRSSRTPLDLPNFNLNYEKNSFCEKLDFPEPSTRSRSTAFLQVPHRDPKVERLPCSGGRTARMDTERAVR